MHNLYKPSFRRFSVSFKVTEGFSGAKGLGFDSSLNDLVGTWNGTTGIDALHRGLFDP